MVGVAAANTSHSNIVIAGIAGLIAGAMSMAAGEYVSVSSQTDTEDADIAREKKELAENKTYEREELASIYTKRGLDLPLARKVADQLMRHDALAAHARDELGISERVKAQPVQAAVASASTFSVGGALPLVIALIVPAHLLIPFVSGASILFLILLGAVAAYTGGASMWRGALRVAFWGIFAMALTAGVGSLFGIK
jgi:VIT1/CCC1 family predicted Fe2+/Mn2+ transporter